MSLSLYDVTVPAYTQILTALAGVLEKAEAHCAAKGMAVDDCAAKRLFEDMAPLSFQVMQTITHSLGALEATQKGVFSPDTTPPPASFAALKQAVAGALAALNRFTPAGVNALEGRDMAFQFKDRRMEFTAQDFLLSFSMPNFYFHATTAYDILRHNGVPLGKRDFMGMPRMKA